MYISYSGWKLYSDCPKAYWHRYIDKTRPKDIDNKINSLYGSGVGTIFELFYRNKVWKDEDPTATLLAMSESVTRKVIQDIVRKDGPTSIRWDDPQSNYKSIEALLKDINKAIPKGIEAIRENHLVGRDAIAENKLDGSFGTKHEHILGGRSDFSMRRARMKDQVIIDGKGSKYLGEYVDDSQLLWYAMLWRRKYGFTPDRLAFLYWRAKPEKAIAWVPFIEQDLDSLRERVLGDLASIEGRQARLRVVKEAKQAFEPKPGKACRFCSFKDTCPEGLEGLATTQRSGVNKGLPLIGGSDVEEVGL